MDHASPWARWRGAFLHALCLTGPGRRSPSAPGAAGAYHWLVPSGLLIGLGYTVVYRAVWRQFGEVRTLPLMPAVAVWLVDVGLFGMLFYLGAARTVRGLLSRSPAPELAAGRDVSPYPVESLSLLVFVVLKLMLLISIPHGISGWPGPGDWRSHFNWMYAHAYYRPLILLPMWGRWSMLLVASIGRLRDETDTTWTSFCASLSAGRVLVWMVPVTVLTSIYCARLGRWMFGCIIACVVLAGTYLYGVLAARRQGGQTRDSIRGGALIGELIFLVVYEALAGNIYAS
jgi:hypothetical protein